MSMPELELELVSVSFQGHSEAAVPPTVLGVTTATITVVHRSYMGLPKPCFQ